jgi:hypothetical protein
LRDFVCYKVFGFHRRLLDWSLAQIDILFMREEYLFLADKRFAAG